MQVGLILSLYLASLRAVNAAAGQVLSTWCHGPTSWHLSLVVSGRVCWWQDEMFMTRCYAKENRTTFITACSDKSVAYITNNKRLCSTFFTIEANYWQTRSIARPLCDSRATCVEHKLSVSWLRLCVILIMNVCCLAWMQLFKTHVDYVERTRPSTAENIHRYVSFIRHITNVIILYCTVVWDLAFELKKCLFYCTDSHVLSRYVILIAFDMI